MKLLEAFGLGKDWGGTRVFEGLSCSVNPGDKIGLMGRNGCGKTTLLEILAGLDGDYTGSVKTHRRCRIAYVPQYLRDDLSTRVSDFLLRDISVLRGRLSSLEAAMGEIGGADLEAVLEDYQNVRDDYDGRAGDTAESRMERLLGGAGLAGKQDVELENLSGGERNVLTLLRAMISLPDLILLDEPGNHLDYAGLAWLESFLKQQKCAVILVSHNRYLLDRVVGKIWDMSGGGLVVFSGNYSAFRLEKLKNTGAAGKLYQAEQKKIRRLEDLVKRFEEAARNTADPAWGRRLHARRTQLEKMREGAVDKPEVDETAADLTFSGKAPRADIALSVSGYSKSFDTLELFKDASLYVGTGERAALIGPNGCGKSTFLNDLTTLGGWDNPVLKVGPSMVIGYCAQHQEVFHTDGTIMEEFEKLGPGSRDEIYRFLSRFNFAWEDLDRPAGTLSGGEKNRLQLARAIYLKANFLVLDEPTNHLDIATREAIEEGLEDFQGTVLVVSHDRYFLDKIVDRVIEVTDGHFSDYRGNFSEYWAVRSSLNRRKDSRIERRGSEIRRKRPRNGDRGRQKDLEERIMRLEAEQRSLEKGIDEAYRNADYQRGSSLSKNLEKVTVMIERIYEEWGGS